MLGELGHIEGGIQRMRFALGCAGAGLVLPPWGRAATGVWTMIVLATGAVGLYAGMAVHYGLGGGDWIWVSILTGSCSAPCSVPVLSYAGPASYFPACSAACSSR